MKPKAALLKLWGKKERLLYIYLQLYLHELFHAFRCQTVTSKQSPWITCKESKNTYIKIIPIEIVTFDCSIRKLSATSQAMHSTSVSIVQCKFTISFTIVSRGDWL